MRSNRSILLIQPIPCVILWQGPLYQQFAFLLQFGILLQYIDHLHSTIVLQCPMQLEQFLPMQYIILLQSIILPRSNIPMQSIIIQQSIIIKWSDVLLGGRSFDHAFGRTLKGAHKMGLVSKPLSIPRCRTLVVANAPEPVTEPPRHRCVLMPR